MPERNGSSVQDVLSIHDEVRARTFLSALMHWELGAFAEGQYSPQEVARLTERPLGQVLRHIKRLEEMNLLEVKRVQKRAGRPIRFYGLTASAFYIPSHIVSPDELLPLVSGFLREKVEEELLTTLHDVCGVRGTQISLSGPNPGIRLAHRPGELVDFKKPGLPVTSNFWTSFSLTHADATAMSEELKTIFSKYAQREGPQVYALHLLFTPLTKN